MYIFTYGIVHLIVSPTNKSAATSALLGKSRPHHVLFAMKNAISRRP